MGYLHIDNLYKNRDIFEFSQCYAMEKIHGTSAHIRFLYNNHESTYKVNFYSGGCSQLEFIKLFNQDSLVKSANELISSEEVVVYGEAYGGKVQRMSKTYGNSLKFVVFDIKLDEDWLTVPEAENVTKSFDLEFVHYKLIQTNITDINNERDADSVQAIRNGMGAGYEREGVVLRPTMEMQDSKGNRIIVKHKRDGFAERIHQPKIEDSSELVILTEAASIANEWVVPMRLEHVLQKLPHAKSLENTREVLDAMIEDIYREARSEIVMSKEVSTAIKRKTAVLWKNKLKEGVNRCDQ